jgi:hypothetical protein
MSRADLGAAVTLSIDLELAIGRQTSQGQQRLAEVTAGLVELLDAQCISATWGVSNPALSAATEAILTANVRQEIAVLGERFWLGDGMPPSRLAREFERRIEGGRKAGIAVSTLLLRQDEKHVDLNLLLNHGIAAVRGAGIAASCEGALLRSAPMRYGIWQVLNPILIPLAGSWWQAAPWAFGQQLQGAAKTGRSLNLVLDAGKMAEYSDLALPAVDLLLRKLGEMQADKILNFLPLGERARQHLNRRAAQPSRSILAA